MQELRILRRSIWRMPSSGMFRRVALVRRNNISKTYIASIFRGRCNMFLRKIVSFYWSHRASDPRRHLSMLPPWKISQQTTFFVPTGSYWYIPFFVFDLMMVSTSRIIIFWSWGLWNCKQIGVLTLQNLLRHCSCTGLAGHREPIKVLLQERKNLVSDLNPIEQWAGE
jgi:hypothetical protein